MLWDICIACLLEALLLNLAEEPLTALYYYAHEMSHPLNLTL